VYNEYGLEPMKIFHTRCDKILGRQHPLLRGAIKNHYSRIPLFVSTIPAILQGVLFFLWDTDPLTHIPQPNFWEAGIRCCRLEKQLKE